ncbi:MAG: histidinol-phosphate transaminase [Desulfofustis sp.]
MKENGLGVENIVKKQILKLPKYQAGLPEEAVRRRYHVERIARLASNENPFGTSPLALNAVGRIIAQLWKYSDPDSASLRAALSNSTGTPDEKIVVGNGSEDLIALICRACLENEDRVITVHPSFLLHEIYPWEQGADVAAVPMQEDFSFDVDGLIKELRKGCRMLIFSNPSNPVGTLLDRSGFEQLCRAASPETILVIDEAYYEYVKDLDMFPDSLSIMEKFPNPHVVLRSFSKAYGLAGARVGYGLFSHTSFADQINKLRNPFNVNLIAQATAEAALSDREHIERTVRFNEQERARVTAALQSIGIRVAWSYANFLFVDSGRSSLETAEKLLAQGIIVKPWTARGYETFLRITIGRSEDNDRMVSLLAE